MHAATHPEASWDVCGAEAIPLALAARVREDSAAPRLRWVHSRRRGPGETPQYPRARGDCRSRGWCATLPALLPRLRLLCPVESQPAHPLVKECLCDTPRDHPSH